VQKGVGKTAVKWTVGSIRATVRASWEAPLLVRLQPLAWASLVATAGPAAADALDSWSTAPRAVATLILWAGWGAVMLASFAPRPLGLTALRVAAPVAVVLALATAPTAGVAHGLLAVAGTALAGPAVPGGTLPGAAVARSPVTGPRRGRTACPAGPAAQGAGEGPRDKRQYRQPDR